MFMKKMTAIIGAGALSLALLCGCTGGNGGNGGNDTPDDPETPQAYTAAQVQAIMQGIQDARYLDKACVVADADWEIDQEFADLMNEEVVQDAVDTLLSFAGVNKEELSETSAKALFDCMQGFLKKAKVQVVSCEQTGEGTYSALVTVNPMDFIGNVGSLTMMDLEDAYVEDVANLGATAARDKYITGMIAALEEAFSRMEYMDGVTFKFDIEQVETALSWDTASDNSVAAALIQYSYPNAG